MTTSPYRQNLETRYQDLQRWLKVVARHRSALQSTQTSRSRFPPVCYDNRHHNDYYAKFEQRAQKLSNKQSPSLVEQEEIINQLLSHTYYKNFYHGFTKSYLPAPERRGLSLESIRHPGISPPPDYII